VTVPSCPSQEARLKLDWEICVKEIHRAEFESFGPGHRRRDSRVLVFARLTHISKETSANGGSFWGNNPAATRHSRPRSSYNAGLRS